MKKKSNLKPIWVLALALVLTGATVVGWTNMQSKQDALYLADGGCGDNDNDNGNGGGNADSMPSEIKV